MKERRKEKAQDLFDAAYDGELSLKFWLEFLKNLDFESRMKLLNSRTDGGDTPLHFAVKGNRYDVVKKFLELGADINAINYGDSTSLHEAAKIGSYEIVSLLIEHEADINAKNMKGETPLSLAIENNHEDIIALLEPKKK